MTSNCVDDKECDDNSINDIPMKELEQSSTRRVSGRSASTLHENSKVGRYERRQIRSCTYYICPTCQLTIRPDDLISHLDLETRKLKKIIDGKLVRRKPNNSGSGGWVSGLSASRRPEKGDATTFGHKDTAVPSGEEALASTSGSSSAASAHADNSECFASLNENVDENPKNEFEDLARPEVFKRIKINRVFRVQSKRWQYKNLPDDATCPVCQEIVFASGPDELQLHVEECLKKQEDDATSDGEIDVEGDEYEWCGMRKVRLTSLLRSQGQLEALGTRLQKGNEDENVEVCMLDGEENQYGPIQYSGEDLFSNDFSGNGPDENNIDNINPDTAEYQQCDVSQQDQFSEYSANNPIVNPSEMDTEVSAPIMEGDGGLGNDQNGDLSVIRSCNSRAVLIALHEKIKDLESKGNFICHICHGQYVTPLTSVTCWHVHCEKCWLQALSTQKLCPQCKAIVSPTDLRRVYL